jgi:hypothetical protein
MMTPLVHTWHPFFKVTSEVMGVSSHITPLIIMNRGTGPAIAEAEKMMMNDRVANIGRYILDDFMVSNQSVAGFIVVLVFSELSIIERL